MQPTARIYVRPRTGVVRSYWTWDLVSADGHTVESSGPFSTREECHDDAALQGLPVSGTPHHRSSQSWTMCRDETASTWRWQCLEESGATISRSKQAFVTARQCIGNARENGCVTGITFEA
jgi:hypothetical protein